MNSRFTIACDFDGTIAKHRFPHIGEPVPGALEWLRRHREAGADLILWTMRCRQGSMGDVLTPAVQWSETHGVYFWGVNDNPEQRESRWSTSAKVYAHAYADDSAAGAPLIRPPGDLPYLNWELVGPHLMNLLKWFQQVGRMDMPEGYSFSTSPQVELRDPKLVTL